MTTIKIVIMKTTTVTTMTTMMMIIDEKEEDKEYIHAYEDHINRKLSKCHDFDIKI